MLDSSPDFFRLVPITYTTFTESLNTVFARAWGCFLCFEGLCEGRAPCVACICIRFQRASMDAIPYILRHSSDNTSVVVTVDHNAGYFCDTYINIIHSASTGQKRMLVRVVSINLRRATFRANNAVKETT